MPLITNQETGLVENIPSEKLNPEQHFVPTISPEGEASSTLLKDLPAAIREGYRQPSQDEAIGMLKTAHFNQPTEQSKAFIRGLEDAATFGGAAALRRAGGANPANEAQGNAYNPGLHALGQVAGLGLSSILPFGEGAVLGKIGEAASAKVLGALGEGAMGQMASGAVKGALENAIFQSTDEGAKFIMQDPSQTAETAISNIGLGAALGAGLGGALGAVKPGFNSLMETKVGQGISDFTNRMKEHFEIPQPVKEVSESAKAWNDMVALKNVADRSKIGMPQIESLPMSDAVTPGAKLADKFMEKGLGEMLASTLGGMAGAKLGHPMYGAMLGERFLADRFNSVLPSIIKPLLNSVPSGSGLRSAMDYGVEAIKGEARLNAAVKNIFNSSKIVVSEPSNKDLEKLKTKLDRIAVNPDEMTQVGGNIGHYMPDHATALGEIAARASKYLISQKPEAPQGAPLDPTMPLSKSQEASYNSALSLAQEPLAIISKIKNGDISLADMQHINSLYPFLQKSISRKLTDQLVEAKDKGYNIPYKTKLGMSIFMGQPLESSMQPNSISAAQATFARPQPQQQPMKAPSEAKMNGLNKMPGLAQLPSQAREAYKSTGHR